MKQKHLSLLLLLLSMLMIPTGSFAASPVRLFIKGSYVQGDVAPIIVKDRTLVPLRLISETLNYDVTWNGADRSVRIVQNDRAIDLKIGSTTAYGLQSGTKKKIAMDVAPIIVKDRTLVPLRFISENFGEKVDWDAKSRTVIIGEGYSPRTNPDALTLHFRNKTFNIEAKMYRGQTMIPAEDFAKAMGWNYVRKLNEYEEKVPVLHDPANGVEIYNYGNAFQCDGILFKPMDGENATAASAKIGGRDYLSLRHLADVLNLNIEQIEGQITLRDKSKAQYKLYYKPLLNGGERYGYEAAKVNSIQFKNHHYYIMPLNKTPEEYIRQGIHDKEMTPIGMYNFYMNVDKNIVEAASQG